MDLELDSGLVEEAVFHVMRERSGDEARCYREDLDPAYALAGDARERAFRRVHEEWFRRAGLADLLRRVVGEFPLLESTLDRLSFVGTTTSKSEGAELLVRRQAPGPNRAAVVAVRAQRFAGDEGLTAWLRRELYHIADMVDPAFRYEPWLGETNSPAAENLVRDRYAVLWNLWIEIRLQRTGRTAATPCDVAPLRRVFGHPDLAVGIARWVEGSRYLTHHELLACARMARQTEAATRSW